MNKKLDYNKIYIFNEYALKEKNTKTNKMDFKKVNEETDDEISDISDISDVSDMSERSKWIFNKSYIDIINCYDLCKIVYKMKKEMKTMKKRIEKLEKYAHKQPSMVKIMKNASEIYGQQVQYERRYIEQTEQYGSRIQQDKNKQEKIEMMIRCQEWSDMSKEAEQKENGFNSMVGKYSVSLDEEKKAV